MTTKKKAKKTSGPSGRNTKPGVLVRMDPNSIVNLRKAAKRRGITLTRWINDACERLYREEGEQRKCAVHGYACGLQEATCRKAR